MSAASLPLRHLLLALAVVFVWGTNFVAIKWVLQDLPPFLFAALRFALAWLPAALFVKRPAVRWRLLASGFLAGVSVAFKLSNGPIAVVLPLLWCMTEGALSTRVRRVLVAGLFTLAGFALTYGYWGWLLWSRFGNPFFTIYDGVLAALGRVLGLRP